MFGHDSLPTRVYKFAADSPCVNADLVNDEMSRMHKYRNRLVEHELARRAAVETKLASMRPTLATIAMQAESADKAVEEAMAAARQRNAEAKNKRLPKEEKAEIAALKKTRNESFAARKAARAEAFAAPDVKGSMKIIDDEFYRTAKELAANSGLYWGNKAVVAQSCGSLRAGAPPRFHRWEWDGKIAVQVQGGMDTKDVYDGGSLLQIDTPKAMNHPDWSTKTVDRRTMVRLRIGSTEEKRPIFTEFSIIQHRPLPDMASIKWAWLVRKQVGTKMKWSLQLVLSKAGGFTPPDLAKSGAVGIDVGWRVTDAGLRVAKWVGSDGETGELVLPMDRVDRTKIEQLQSIRDMHFNGARAVLAAWRDREPFPAYAGEHAEWTRRKIAGAKNPVELKNINAEYAAWRTISLTDMRTDAPLPEWFAERVKTLKLWRSPAKLAALILFWRDNRFDGDAEIHAAIEQWRKRDKHLYEWQVNAVRGHLANRKDVYRNFAAILSRKYRTAIVEDTNWSKLQKNKSVEQDATPGAVKHYMRSAAVGELIEIVAHRMGETVKAPAKETTRRHNACGELSGEPNPEHLHHVCAHCGAVYDQDDNAARNLLASGGVAGESPEPCEPVLV